MYDFDYVADFSDRAEIDWIGKDRRALDAPSRLFRSSKRAFDIFLSLLLLPTAALVALTLLVLNPFFNRGPLFFVQTRMGQHCLPFRTLKFRSMVPIDQITRKADDPLEEDRITRLGQFIRMTRLDELPQIWNVLRGEMSLIGPRPDFYDHACVYLQTVPGYRARHAVRPGISGLAQTELGYIQGIDATRAKVNADLRYIRSSSFALEARIFWRTIRTVLGRLGT